MDQAPIVWQGGLQVFEIDLDAISHASAGEELGVLDGEERQRASRMATPLLRRRFVAAHAVTRRILGDALGVGAQDIGFVTGPFGKPSLATPLVGGFHFNLSHCHGRALLAVADCEVGVDLEGWVEHDTARLAGHVLAEDELAGFRECALEDQPRDLARRWAAKEALLKACGVGLQLDPHLVSVDTGGGWHRLPPPAGISPWWLQRIEIAGPFCAFVASALSTEATVVRYT